MFDLCEGDAILLNGTLMPLTFDNWPSVRVSYCVLICVRIKWKFPLPLFPLGRVSYCLFQGKGIPPTPSLPIGMCSLDHIRGSPWQYRTPRVTWLYVNQFKLGWEDNDFKKRNCHSFLFPWWTVMVKSALCVWCMCYPRATPEPHHSSFSWSLHGVWFPFPGILNHHSSFPWWWAVMSALTWCDFDVWFGMMCVLSLGGQLLLLCRSILYKHDMSTTPTWWLALIAYE